MENMELWNSVATTDPATTKKVSTRGGFTTVCAQSQIKKATSIWGPYGKAWGLYDCKFGEIYGKDHVPVEVFLEATFRYPGGEFPISSDIKFREGGECRKKVMTDCTTKALSKLGFNSDIFEGKFDDNRYVAEMNQKFGNNNQPLATAPQQPVIPGVGTVPTPQFNNIPGVRR